MSFSSGLLRWGAVATGLAVSGCYLPPPGYYGQGYGYGGQPAYVQGGYYQAPQYSQQPAYAAPSSGYAQPQGYGATSGNGYAPSGGYAPEGSQTPGDPSQRY